MTIISIEEALSLIKDTTKYKHSLLVSQIMNMLAKHFNKPEKDWILVGLLHDLDYDTIEDFSQHGLSASMMLADRLPQESLHAIRAHDHRTGTKPNSLLDDALIFADSFAIFLESNAHFDKKDKFFVAKPWIWNNLIKFQEKYEFNVVNLIEQFQYLT
jgi:predicted hydrolase (HD superfamily)